MSILVASSPLNRPVDLATAEKCKIFFEIIMAPAFDDDAYAVLAKKKNVRLLTINTADTLAELGTETTAIYGGLLIQTRDNQTETPADMTVVTTVKPTDEQLKALAFAQTVVKHVKSNAIVVAQADQTLGHWGRTNESDWFG